MAQREKGAGGAGGDRLDALLEERFKGGGRREMAHQIADHDRKRAAASFDTAHVRRKLRFRGDIPDKTKEALRNWLPEMLAYAAERGLRLRDLNHEIHFFDRVTFESSVSPIPAEVKLPASSYQFNQLYKVFTVRVVLPDEPPSLTQLLTVLRAALSRLLGDIFLGEEIYGLEAYREDRRPEAAGVSASLEEQIKLLADPAIASPLLERHLPGYAREINLNYKRQPDQVRKAYFQDSLRALEANKLAGSREQLIGEAFDAYLDELSGDLGAALSALVEETEKLNGQLNFLPLDELPDYLKLRESNPLHYLRSAKLRLGFLLEALGALLDAFGESEESGTPPSPLLDEQLEGYLGELRTQGLARPYLIPDARLSDELEKKKAAFPFEVHALLERMPKTDNPGRAFKSLSKKLTNSIYQRLYNALLLLNAWIKAREQGREESFRTSGRHQTLKGQIANFRFRRPLLESLFIKIGIVQDCAEAAGESSGGAVRRRFPAELFAQAWGQFIPHAVVAGYFESKGGAQGFEPGRYWKGVEESWLKQIAQGPGPHHLAYGLHSLFTRSTQAGEEGLTVLVELLKNPPGTFRFMVTQALTTPEEKAAKPEEERPEALTKWAGLVLKARAASLRYAIKPGDLP